MTAWTVYFSNENVYYTGVLNPTLTSPTLKRWKEETHFVVQCRSETTLLSLFNSLLKTKQPHAIAYWNGKVADREYPEARAKHLGIQIDFSPYDFIDLCRGYEIRFKRLYYRLKDVAVDEGIYDPSSLVAEEFHKDMWHEGLKDPSKLDLFISYNHMDVRILVLLDLLGWERYDETKEKTVQESPREICSDILNLKSFVGLEDASATFFNSVAIDTFTLRKAHKKGVVLNSASESKGKSYHGAEPFCPPAGVYPNIKTLDASRYYPNLIIAYSIDELMSEVVNELNTLRDEYEQKIEQLKVEGYDQDSPQVKAMESRRDTVKFLLNSTYGYLGSPRSRKYQKEKASKITEKARLGLDTVKRAMEQRKVPVIYGHTDSIFIQCKDNETEELLTYLNNVVLANLCKNECIPPLLRFKLEKVCSKGIFVDAKNKPGTGAKAHYALHVVWEKGHPTDYIAIVGFDYVRGNTSPVARKVQLNVITAILRGTEKTISPTINKIVKAIRNGEYPYEKIATPMNIKCKLDASNAFHVKAARWSNKNLGLEIIEGDRVKLLPVKRVIGKEPTNVIAFFDEENLKKISFIPNYEEVIEKTIYSKTEQFLKLINMTRRDIEGHYNPTEDWF